MQGNAGQLHIVHIDGFDVEIVGGIRRDGIEGCKSIHHQRLDPGKGKAAAEAGGCGGDRPGARRLRADVVNTRDCAIAAQAQHIAIFAIVTAAINQADTARRCPLLVINEDSIIPQAAIKRDLVRRCDRHTLPDGESIIARAAVDGDRVIVSAVRRLKDIVPAAQRNLHFFHAEGISAHRHDV